MREVIVSPLPSDDASAPRGCGSWSRWARLLRPLQIWKTAVAPFLETVEKLKPRLVWVPRTGGGNAYDQESDGHNLVAVGCSRG